MSVKSEQYKLAHVYAVEVIYEITDSANLPLVVGGVDTNTSERSEYAVKLNASERMTVQARMFELIAAFMAIELELYVVEPVIVEISEEFIDMVKGQDYFLKCSKSLGYNYGSSFIKGLLILDNKILLTAKQKEQAQEILAFDMLIGNVDRNEEKPNMITDGDRLVLLDHELAFSFVRVLSFLRNSEPWSFNEEDKSIFLKHCLYTRVKGHINRLDEFCEKMTRFDASFWESVKSNIPEEWYSQEEFESIRGHVDLMVANRHDFIQNVKLLLS